MKIKREEESSNTVSLKSQNIQKEKEENKVDENLVDSFSHRL